MNYELDFWLSKRKDLECAMIRKYIYSKKILNSMQPVEAVKIWEIDLNKII